MIHRPALPLLRHFIMTCSLLLAGSSFGHPGTLDQQGGHFRHDQHSYHCHREPCHTLHRQAETALQEAQRKQRAFSNTYRREDWPHWSDSDADCQNTRAEILIATSRKPVQFHPHRQQKPCSVRRGEWYDPYSNRTFTTASQLDIDHIIALAEAHRYGGANWPGSRKEQFANDPLNLIPVQREVNRAKGSLPAHQWMPKNLAYWCDYLRSREAVAEKYRLQLPAPEQQFQQKIRQQHCR